LGEVEHSVLLAMMRLDSRAYGVPIVLSWRNRPDVPSLRRPSTSRFVDSKRRVSSLPPWSPRGVRCRSIRFLRREAI